MTETDRLRPTRNEEFAKLASTFTSWFPGGSFLAYAVQDRTSSALTERWIERITQMENAITQLGMDYAQRHLSPREDLRLGSVLASAVTEIKGRLEQGETLRDDGFFDSDESGRSDAEEVGEHILLKAQREPEEKKLPYMAHMLANLAFVDAIDADMAHKIVKTAEQLTYRQFCLLRLAAIGDKPTLRDKSYVGQTRYPKVYTVLSEIYDLNQLEYVRNGRTIVMRQDDVIPSNLELAGAGKMFYALAQLQEIPDGDIATLVEVLKE